MVDDGKITLTLGELKEYFKIWHENKFNDLHTTKVQEIISNYLNTHNITNKVNIIDDIRTNIISSIKVVSKIINGRSDLEDSSTLNDAITELNGKYKNFIENNNKYNNLASISKALRDHDTSISEKATIGYVNDQISEVNDNLGVIPKQIQTQDIPVVGFGTDLNNYTTPGLYYNKNSSTDLQNVPSEARGSNFVLVVLQHTDDGARQLLLTPEASNIGNNIFTRNYTNSSWSGGEKWDKLYGSHNTQPLQMKIEWSDVPNTSTTYTLLQIRE